MINTKTNFPISPDVQKAVENFSKLKAQIPNYDKLTELSGVIQTAMKRFNDLPKIVLPDITALNNFLSASSESTRAANKIIGDALSHPLYDRYYDNHKFIPKRFVPNKTLAEILKRDETTTATTSTSTTTTTTLPTQEETIPEVRKNYFQRMHVRIDWNDPVQVALIIGGMYTFYLFLQAFIPGVYYFFRWIILGGS